MNELPDIWRTELWHPVSVHFPIVLLLGAGLLSVLRHFAGSKHARFIHKMSGVFLYTGSVTIWISIYTGTLADSIVTRDLCDPTILEAHENAAFTLGYLFTAASLIDLIDFIPSEQFKKLKHPLKGWLVTLLLVGGGFYLMYTAHLGARLVYQQGAAVYQPTENCREFE
ncbi:MAG: DUF2231 domain-containing protein [Balneolaceae bacterium]